MSTSNYFTLLVVISPLIVRLGRQCGSVVKADSIHVGGPGSIPAAGREKNDSWLPPLDKIDVQMGQ